MASRKLSANPLFEAGAPPEGVAARSSEDDGAAPTSEELLALTTALECVRVRLLCRTCCAVS